MCTHTRHESDCTPDSQLQIITLSSLFAIVGRGTPPKRPLLGLGSSEPLQGVVYVVLAFKILLVATCRHGNINLTTESVAGGLAAGKCYFPAFTVLKMYQPLPFLSFGIYTIANKGRVMGSCKSNVYFVLLVCSSLAQSL